MLLSGVCFGFLGIFGKQAFALGLSPGEFLSLRFLVASALLGSWLLASRPQSLRLSRGEIGRCAILGIGGYAVFSSFFFMALSGLSASLTVLLLYTFPVIVSIGAWILFREQLSRAEIVALPITLLGLGLLVWGEIEVRSTGAVLLGILSAVFYSAYILTSSRWTRGTNAFSACFYIMLFAGLALSAVHIRRLPDQLDVWLVVAAASFISSVLAMGLFLAALQKLKNSEVSLLSTAEPVTGVFLAAVLLGERMLPPQILGGSLVLAGMVLVAVAQRSKPLENRP